MAVDRSYDASYERNYPFHTRDQVRNLYQDGWHAGRLTGTVENLKAEHPWYPYRIFWEQGCPVREAEFLWEDGRIQEGDWRRVASVTMPAEVPDCEVAQIAHVSLEDPVGWRKRS